MDGELGDPQVADAADDMHFGVPGVDAVGEAFRQLLVQRQDVGAAAQLQDVDGVLGGGGGDDGRARRHVTGRDGDVGVHLVRQVGHDEPRVRRPDVHVGLPAVDVPGDDRQALALLAGGLREVGLDEAVGNVVKSQPLHQARRQRIVAADDHVAGQIVRHIAGGAAPYLCLQPRRVERAYQGEGQQDEEHDDARHQHENAEDPPDIAVEDDVAEPQRAHDRQGPVETRDPGVVLTFQADHDDVEDDGVDDDHSQQDAEKLEQHAQVAPGFRELHEGDEQADKDFHVKTV